MARISVLGWILFGLGMEKADILFLDSGKIVG